MSHKLVQSIDKLIEATSFIDEEAVIHNCDSPYGHYTISGHKLGLSVDKELIGKAKGFILQEGISISSFVNYALKKALDEIERTKNITLPVLDPSVRIAYGNRKSPEQKLSSTIRKFRSHLKKLRHQESVGQEEDEK